MAGGFNTVFGYSVGVCVYKVLGSSLSILWIGAISNMLTITVSFFAYKIFVFRTKGKWLSEYLRSYVVYGGIAIVGIFLLWLFVDIIKTSIWLAQAIILGVTVIISYIGHSRFTFDHKRN